MPDFLRESGNQRMTVNIRKRLTDAVAYTFFGFKRSCCVVFSMRRNKMFKSSRFVAVILLFNTTELLEVLPFNNCKWLVS